MQKVWELCGESGRKHKCVCSSELLDLAGAVAELLARELAERTSFLHVTVLWRAKGYPLQLSQAT